MIKAIVFDVDGTLYPQWRIFYSSLPYFLLHRKLVASFWKARKKIRKMDNLPVSDWSLYQKQAELVSTSLKMSLQETQAVIDKKIYQKWERTFRFVKPYRNVDAVLKELRLEGYKLAVMSDVPIGKKLQYFGLEGYWDLIMTSEESEYLKPHKAPFQLLAKRLEMNPDEILYVGNSFEYDAVGAKEAGLWAALITRKDSMPPADFTFKNYFSFLSAFKAFSENIVGGKRSNPVRP